MRVFVLTTGRTGSTTIAKAFELASNFSAAHESRARLLLPDRLDYPDQHVEIDNRLVFYLALLPSLFDDDQTVYVHLKRNRSDVIRSFERRWIPTWSICRAWGDAVLIRGHVKRADRVAVIADFVDWARAVIDAFLAQRQNSFVVDLDDPLPGMREVWDFIGATGEWERIEAVMATMHNESRRGVGGRQEHARATLSRVWHSL